MTDCVTLETLIENHERVDLIDVRSKKEFGAMHIRGARSLPLKDLAQPRLFRKLTLTMSRVYVISDDRGKATLASGILCATGEVDAVVVRGGMEAWVAQGFPVLRRRMLLSLPRLLAATGILLVILAASALALSDLLVGSFIILFAGAVLLKARSEGRRRRGKTHAFTRTEMGPGALTWHQ